MAEKKMTKKETLEAIKATLTENFEAADVAEYVEFIDAEVTVLDKRAEKERERRAAKKVEGDGLKGAIKAVIDGAEEPITAEDIADKIAEDFPEVTKAKVTYRASALAKDGEVDKTKVTVDGRKIVAYAPAGTVETDAE